MRGPRHRVVAHVADGRHAESLAGAKGGADIRSLLQVLQHRMAEEAHAKRIAATLAAPNAHGFIAGASNQMPKAVRAALRAAAVAHGGGDEAAADALLRTLANDPLLATRNGISP